MHTKTLPLAKLVDAESVELFEVEIQGFVAELKKCFKPGRGRREELGSTRQDFGGSRSGQW